MGRPSRLEYVQQMIHLLGVSHKQPSRTIDGIDTRRNAYRRSWVTAAAGIISAVCAQGLVSADITRMHRRFDEWGAGTEIGHRRTLPQDVRFLDRLLVYSINELYRSAGVTSAAAEHYN
jgi:hypothetical protein